MGYDGILGFHVTFDGFFFHDYHPSLQDPCQLGGHDSALQPIYSDSVGSLVGIYTLLSSGKKNTFENVL